MSKKRLGLHAASLSFLTAPNLLYLGLNFDVLKEANALALTMSTMLILSVVGLGALTHFKPNKGIWLTLIGVFVLALSNVSYLAGMALIIEGGALALDGYVFKPLILNEKAKELERDGKQVTYTREIK